VHGSRFLRGVRVQVNCKPEAVDESPFALRPTHEVPEKAAVTEEVVGDRSGS
jgi:hypothetical protein